MNDEIKRVDGRVTVTKTVFGKEEVTEDTIAVQAFQTQPANVSVKAGCTVNMTNYESGRIDIMVSIPCYKEEIDDVFPRVKDWVDERMTKEYQELKKAAGGK